MTAKEKLAEHVQALTEDEAAEALELLGLDDPGEWPDFPPAPAHIIELARRAMRDADNGGPTFSTAEVLEHLGID